MHKCVGPCLIPLRPAPAPAFFSAPAASCSVVSSALYMRSELADLAPGGIKLAVAAAGVCQHPPEAKAAQKTGLPRARLLATPTSFASNDGAAWREQERNKKNSKSDA